MTKVDLRPVRDSGRVCICIGSVGTVVELGLHTRSHPKLEDLPLQHENPTVRSPTVTNPQIVQPNREKVNFLDVVNWRRLPWDGSYGCAFAL